MAQLQVTKDQTKKLPVHLGTSFNAGLGWDPAKGQDEVDLDLWILRKHEDGRVEALYWGNQGWHRPDLGHTSQGLPWIATPELDVIHKGDDRTGGESDTGYDENAAIDVSKTPASVVQYAVFTTYYDQNGTGKTLGEATNILCGVTQDGTGNELQAKVEENHGWDVSLLVCTIDRGEDGSWSMTNKSEGFTDDMVTVARKAGVVFA